MSHVVPLPLHCAALGTDLKSTVEGFGPNPGQAGLREVTCLRSCNSRQQNQDSDDICVTHPAPPRPATSDAQPLCCNPHHRGFCNNTTLCIFLVKKPQSILYHIEEFLCLHIDQWLFVCLGYTKQSLLRQQLKMEAMQCSGRLPQCPLQGTGWRSRGHCSFVLLD